MRKLIYILLALPCLAVVAETIDKVVLVVKNNGDKVAVMVNDVDSITIEDADIVDDRYFILDKDTVFITDTLVEHDTVNIVDTITNTDTIVRVDTVTRIDTLIQTKNYFFTDTINIHDTTYIYDVSTRNINTPDKWYCNLENPSVSDFLNDFEYPDSDYTFSNIERYLVDTPYSKDRPLGVMLYWDGGADELLVADNANMENANRYNVTADMTSFCVYNLIPGKKYYWQALSAGTLVKSSYFQTLGRMRMINLDGAHNVRDIGGMPTSDGRHIKYGRIFRGGTIESISENDRSILKDSLGINVEIDVRTQNDYTTSPILGEDVAYHSFTGLHCNYIRLISQSSHRLKFYNILHQILQDLRNGNTIYLHCGGGADRTGAIALLLEALAGCSENDIAKDYEITSFSIYGTRMRTYECYYDGLTFEYARAIDYLKSRGKNSFQEDAAYYFQLLGFTTNEVEELRNLLVE